MIQAQKQRNIISSTAFYDAIADEYDSCLDEFNRDVRKAMAQTLKKYFQKGVVLDFGGGTGLDLHWLKDDYTVLFLEPSTKMRAIAQNHFAGFKNIVFIEDHLDFHRWSVSELPFQEKPDAVLMNLAVFNCIEDIGTLLRKLSLILQPGSVIIAAILRHSVWQHIKQGNVRSAISSLFKKAVIYTNYKNSAHPAYLHTMGDIRKSIKNFFQLEELKELPGTPFKRMVLKKL